MILNVEQVMEVSGYEDKLRKFINQFNDKEKLVQMKMDKDFFNKNCVRYRYINGNYSSGPINRITQKYRSDLDVISDFLHDSMSDHGYMYFHQIDKDKIVSWDDV